MNELIGVKWGDLKEETNFEIDEVLTVTEASEIWGITEGAIRYHIKSNNLIKGVDYRKAGRITLITKKAMSKIYGKK